MKRKQVKIKLHYNQSPYDKWYNIYFYCTRFHYRHQSF